MTIRNRPDYGVYLLNLGNQPTGGYFDVPAIGTRVVMVGAWVGASIVTLNGGYDTLQGGSPTPAIVSVQVGKTPGDPIPLTVGCGVRADNKFDFLRFSWATQANTYAIIVVSDDAQGNGLEMVAAPSVFQGSVAIEENGNTATVNSDGTLDVRQVGGPTAHSVTLTNPALNALPQSGAAAAPQVQPGSIGGSFYANEDAASGATTIVSAASNVNGLVIRTASIIAQTGTVALCAGTSAPSSFTSNPVLLRTIGAGASVSLQREIFLPAGQGLYLYTSAAGPLADLTYDIL